MKLAGVFWTVCVWATGLLYIRHRSNIYDGGATEPVNHLDRVFPIKTIGNEVRYVSQADAIVYTLPLYLGPLLVAVGIAWLAVRSYRRAKSSDG